MVQGAIYKTIDKEGNVTYSDSRPPGQSNEEVKLKAITPLPALSTPNKAQTYTPTREPPSAKKFYSQLKIVEPANGGTVRNEGNFTVRIQTLPTLASGHRARLLLDGIKVGQAKKTMRFTLLNVDRGSHNLLVEIVDGNNRVIQSSKTSKVFVQRSVFRPPPPSN
ncbi:hypothetical protein ACH42_07755 [Endozoicomonas sp. (ex Bugula neritina AB1)]|nr:hypothetical protein ACH42_07755 [Endozoicomonas sp. (ex Bugula neritina AB1)]